jgi:hypothetical protein
VFTHLEPPVDEGSTKTNAGPLGVLPGKLLRGTVVGPGPVQIISAMIENPSGLNSLTGLEPSLAEIAEAMRDATESPADQPFIQFVSMVGDEEWCSVSQVVVQSTSGGVARVAFRSDSNDRNPFLIAMPEAVASSLIHQLHKRFALRKKYPDFFPDPTPG